MPAFQACLQSLLTVNVVLTEYLLLFDRWIITAPGGPVAEREFSRLTSSERRRRRWSPPLKTSTLYALAEPTGCWLIMAMSRSPHLGLIFWFMIFGFVHFAGVIQVDKYKWEKLLEMKKEHEEMCCGGVTIEEQRAQSQDVTPNDDGEQDDEKLLQSAPERTVSPPENQNPVPCVKKHELPRHYRLATLIPALTAGFANAGTILFCRYLATPDSRHWLGKTTFGWTMIVSVAVFIITCGKFVNHRLMHNNTFRPHFPFKTTSDALIAGTCLAIVLLLRAALRALLSQSPMVPVAWSDEQAAFIVQGYPVPWNQTTNEDGTDIEVNPTLLYIGLVNSVCQIVGWGGYFIYRFYRWNQERRRRRYD